MSRLDSLCHRWTGSEASHSIRIDLDLTAVVLFFLIKQEEVV